MGYAVEPW